MPIPMPTTKVNVYGLRGPMVGLDPDGYAYEGEEVPVRTLVDSGVPAHIALAGASRAGDQETTTHIMQCDVANINRYDMVEDINTGKFYEVVTVQHSDKTAFNLDHMRVTLQIVNGLTEEQ